MPRVNRLIQRAQATTFDGTQHYVEDALRGRAARRIRLHVRRMEPVAVCTPRWSEPAAFLEDLALDLAVGDPAVGCRTVNLRPLSGRRASESWQFTLHVFAQLGRREWRHRPPAMVADRGGFRCALRADEEAHESHRMPSPCWHTALSMRPRRSSKIWPRCGSSRGDTRRTGEQRCSRDLSPATGGP